jgi:hypothetical protein
MNALRTSILGVAVLGCVIVSPESFAQDTYSNATLGFSIRKPSAWHNLAAEQHLENLKRSNIQDPKFKEFVARYAQAPFWAIVKHMPPYDDLTPTIKANTREAGTLKGTPPEKVVELMTSGLARILKDYVVAEGPVATTLAGHPAGYLRANFTHEAGGRALPASTELWIVPRGDLLFIIAASTRQDEKSGTRKEVRSIIDTVKID